MPATAAQTRRPLFRKRTFFRFGCTGSAAQHVNGAFDPATQTSREHRITEILTTSIDKVYSAFGTPPFRTLAVLAPEISPTALPLENPSMLPTCTSPMCLDSLISKHDNEAKHGEGASSHRQLLFSRAILTCWGTNYHDPSIVSMPTSPSSSLLLPPSLPLPPVNSPLRCSNGTNELASTLSSGKTSFSLSACSSASWVAQWEAQYDDEEGHEQQHPQGPGLQL